MRERGLSGDALLVIDDLVVSYYKKEILRGTSLEVRNTEIVALVGANGSGKSTLLKAVAGTLRPERGRILFGGVDITHHEPHKLAQMGIGFLMQGGIIFPSLTVMEHLQVAAQIFGKIHLEERLPIIWHTFPLLSRDKNMRAGLMSGGERQMLALSMLLVQKTRLWLLDEPSAGLAPEAVRSTMDVIKQLNLEEKITVLLVEQNLGEGLRIADRTYVLKKGLAFEEERIDNLLDEGKLENLLFG